jgi:type I restriction enzyme, S subunit
MESDFVFQQAERCATGIAQKTVSLSGLRMIVIPLPPLGEQRRIVALMMLCDRLEATLATADNTRSRLLEALLAEALAPVEERELEAATKPHQETQVLGSL